uniref:Uncharacterized protein LOC114337672 n=1 Tax=Diabrotica virgifera virgifera TaxID=50390 RepID=A0A6P7GJN0_DIAVI
MYVQNTHQHNNYKLSSISSIFTAEIIAIEKALEWIKENNIEKAVIITDSRSAIYAIQNTDFNSYKSKILCNIKNNLSKVEVVFIWAKGHAGILGNEKVDELAKDAIKNGEILTQILSTDAINDVKDRINKIWKKQWKNISSISKNLYFSLHQELPPPLEYIFKYNLLKQDISTIVRLKKYEAHLHKLGIVNSSVCFCDNGSIRDLNHIFFECKINERYINQLYYNFTTNTSSFSN